MNGWWIVLLGRPHGVDLARGACARLRWRQVDLSTAVKRLGATTQQITHHPMATPARRPPGRRGDHILVGAVLLLASFWRLTRMSLGSMPSEC